MLKHMECNVVQWGSKQQLDVQLLYYAGFDMWVLLGEHYGVSAHLSDHHLLFEQHLAKLIQYPFDL